MSAARKLMEPDEFLVWCLDQEGRWELVNGYPIRMMTGATRKHDRLVTNLIVALRQRLRPPCDVFTDDVASRMSGGNLRRPDVTVDCGRGDPEGLESEVPTVFFEVLSKSTRNFDLLHKPEEYKQVHTLRHIVMVDPYAPRVWLMSRNTDDWASVDVIGLNATVDLPGAGVSLSMTDIYDGVDLEPDLMLTPP